MHLRSRTTFVLTSSALGLALAASAACTKEPKAAGQPAAQAPRGLEGGSGAGLPVHGGGGMANPHGGGGMANPHGGGDPHAGMDMGGGNPHGGGMQGTSPAPGPLDPATLLEGTLEVSPALAAKIKPGDVIYLSVKQVDAQGNILRMPLAVDRLVAAEFPRPFALSNQNMMVAGGKLEGNVAITARIDRDGDAMTRLTGDIEGIVKTTPPQKGLKLVLDTEVP